MNYLDLLYSFAQALILFLLAPLMSGISRKIRARMHSRIGPMGAGGFLQDYRDLFKLLKRQETAPHGSGFIFRAMPFILIISMMTIAMSLPLITKTPFFLGSSDLITLIYLFGIFRFFFSLSGIDSGSPFAGFGASRELLLGVLVEPILLLGLLVISLIAGSTNIGIMSLMSGTAWGGGMPMATIVAMLACAFAVFVEMGKIPFDYPEAEQELQEGPLTEYSGVGLAMVTWGLRFKQVVIASLFISVFFPFGSIEFSSLTLGNSALSLCIYIAKLLVIFILASVYENSLARGRFLLTSKVTWAGFGLATLAFVFYLIKL